MIAYKKQLAYENTTAYTDFFYKEPGLYAGRCISSTHLLDMAKDYAKKNYMSSNFTMTMFGTHTKALFTDYVKKSYGIKYDFRNLSTAKLKEHLYKKNKDYY
jgi:ABC-type cobalamin/Fe3+-siderophores transport system ATPase subunit